MKTADWTNFDVILAKNGIQNIVYSNIVLCKKINPIKC